MTEGHPSVPPPPYPPYGPPVRAYPPAHPYAARPPGGAGPYPPARPRRSQRGLWIGVGAATLVLALIVVGSVFALASYLDGYSSSPPGPHDLVSDADIEGLLGTHTRALRDRDEKAFLAPFDPADTKLVATQTSFFRNLAKLPFQEARFKEFSSGDFTDTGSGVTFRLRVSFVHQFEGLDPKPVEELYEWTLARSAKDAPLRVTAVAGGLPRIAGSDSSAYYPAPWDVWREIHVERTPHTVLISHAAQRAEARRLAPIAERAAVTTLAAWRIGKVPAEVPQGFVITLAKGKQEMGTLYRTTKETPTESGVAIPVPPAGAIDGETADILDVATTRIVIDAADPTYFVRGDADDQAELLRHEVAHAITNVLSELKPGVPGINGHEKWVVEGFAEWLGHDREPWLKSERTAGARPIFRELGKLEQLPLNVGWAYDGRISYHYWLGHSAIGYLAERHGDAKVIRFVAAHYQGAVAGTALREVFGVSRAEFEKDWAAYVAAKVR